MYIYIAVVSTLKNWLSGQFRNLHDRIDALENSQHQLQAMITKKNTRLAVDVRVYILCLCIDMYRRGHVYVFTGRPGYI